MIRNLKIIGLAVVAVFAMSAMAASAAQANNYWFTSDAGAGVTTFLTGEQITRQPGNLHDELTFTAGTVKCTSTHYTGSVIGPTVSTVTVHPVYSGCTQGFSTEFITTNCNYVFHAETETAGGIYHATATLECSAGSEVTIISKGAGIVKCTIHIEPQDLGTVTFTKGTKANGVKDIHADINLSGIKYTETAGSGAGACVTSTTQSNGLYVGTATLTGFRDEGRTMETSIDLG